MLRKNLQIPSLVSRPSLAPVFDHLLAGSVFAYCKQSKTPLPPPSHSLLLDLLFPCPSSSSLSSNHRLLRLERELTSPRTSGCAWIGVPVVTCGQAAPSLTLPAVLQYVRLSDTLVSCEYHVTINYNSTQPVEVYRTSCVVCTNCHVIAELWRCSS